MKRDSVHYSFIIVDIEKFGRRADVDQRWLRRQMYDVLRNSVEDVGIDWESCAKQDAGDSVILLVPANVSKMQITDSFVGRLDRELGGYARRSAEAVRMRLRVALHAGEVAHDEHGWVGTALNYACRLVDLQKARVALGENDDANLVLVVSDLWYSSVVRQDPSVADHFAFEEIPFVAKEVNDKAWLHIRPRRDVRPDGRALPKKPPKSEPPPRAGGIYFYGDVHGMGDAFQGDKHQVVVEKSDD
jgi:hypothetical protein